MRGIQNVGNQVWSGDRSPRLQPSLTSNAGAAEKCLIGKHSKPAISTGVKALPIIRERIWPRPRVAVLVLVLTFLSSIACASEYCTKEQYERDHALIADAFSNGTLLRGPKGLRDSILVEEGDVVRDELPEADHLHAVL